MPKQIQLLVGLNAALIIAIAASLAYDWRGGDPLPEAGPLKPLAVEKPELVDEIRLNGLALARQEDDTWKVNGEHFAQPEMLRALSYICLQAEVKRPVSEALAPQTRQALESEGVEVVFRSEGQDLGRFRLGSEEGEAVVQTAEGQLYYVHLPGKYVDIPEMFSDSPEYWRDKRLLYTRWKWVQSIDVEYGQPVGKSDLHLSYDSSGFYRVEGVANLDSARLYDYVSRFERFSAKGIVGKDTALLAELSKRAPYCTIRTSNVIDRYDNALRVYFPGPDRQTLYGVSEATGEVVLLETRAVGMLTPPLGYFDIENPNREPLRPNEGG